MIGHLDIVQIQTAVFGYRVVAGAICPLVRGTGTPSGIAPLGTRRGLIFTAPCLTRFGAPSLHLSKNPHLLRHRKGPEPPLGVAKHEAGFWTKQALQGLLDRQSCEGHGDRSCKRERAMKPYPGLFSHRVEHLRPGALSCFDA